MVQEWGLEYFTEQERAAIKATAALYLTPNTPPIWEDFHDVRRFIVLFHAARLAMVLDDPELLGWVEHFAADTEAYKKKTGSESAADQKYLRQALSDDFGYPGPGKSISLDHLFERLGRKQ